MWIRGGDYQEVLVQSGCMLGYSMEKREDITIGFYTEGLLCQDLKTQLKLNQPDKGMKEKNSQRRPKIVGL